jgi:hypothetical protein
MVETNRVGEPVVTVTTDIIMIELGTDQVVAKGKGKKRMIKLLVLSFLTQVVVLLAISVGFLMTHHAR